MAKGFACEIGPMELACDNQSTLYFFSNLIFTKRTNNLEKQDWFSGFRREGGRGYGFNFPH